MPLDHSAEQQVLLRALNRQREHVLAGCRWSWDRRSSTAGSSFGLELHRLGEPPLARC